MNIYGGLFPPTLLTRPPPDLSTAQHHLVRYPIATAKKGAAMTREMLDQRPIKEPKEETHRGGAESNANIQSPASPI